MQLGQTLGWKKNNKFRIGSIIVNIYRKEFPETIFDLEYLNHVYITEEILFKCELSEKAEYEYEEHKMYSERYYWERYREILSEIVNL